MKEIRLSEMLKRLSKEKNVNQSDLARHLELTRQSISLYYSGKITPELDTLVKIAEYFDVSLDYLVTGDRPEHNQVRAELGLSEKAIENLKNHQDDSAARNILLSDENFYSEFSEAMKMFLIFDLMTQDVKVFNDKFSDLGLEGKDILKMVSIEPARIMENYFREFFRKVKC